MVLAVSLPAWADVSETTAPVEVVESLPLLPENADLKQLSQQLELIRQSVPISTSGERLMTDERTDRAFAHRQK